MKKIQLIILEDEVAHAVAIRKSLSDSENNYEIFTATSLKEFNQIVSSLTPDLVIADMKLPDGDSFTILKEQSENQLWPVIVMTSYGDEEMAVKAIKSGALDYIVKSPQAYKNIEHVVSRTLREWYNIQKGRENEKKFRNLFETMAQGVVYQNVDGKITGVNSAAEKIFGLTVDQMLNKTWSDFGWRPIHEDGSVFSEETFPSVMALHFRLPVKDIILGIHQPHKDEIRWLTVNSIPQFKENDKKSYQVFTTFTDITELKKAKEKAEESDRLKSAFLANMSHEIRTPMNGILGFADLLKTPNLSGESQGMYIEAINKSGLRMLEIINDLMDISRIEAGQIEIKKEITNIPELLNELKIFFTPESEQKSVNLRFNIQLPLYAHLIETDRTKLAQIITNLLKNALKFTNSNGYIELGCKILDNSYLCFYVKDTGKGIRKELQNKIFERFRKGDSPEEHEGAGLGLAISKAYVELLGGKIGIKSEPYRGSIFYFNIPFNRIKKPNTYPVEYGNSNESLPCLSVLIVEDDEMSYSLLKESLKRANINTCRARNGLEAVDMVKEQSNINLVLMDIKMPIMNGIEATQQIKEIRPKTHVIMQSGYVSQADVQRSFQAGCDDYITKPIDLNLLLNKISTFCSF